MTIFTRAEAFAPASMGNVGIGFDILGLAFCEPGDIVEVRLSNTPGARMIAIEGDNGKLPLDAAQNTASVAVNAFLEIIHAEYGVDIILKKGLPLASGLGSSAASAVAAVVAANALLGKPLSREELLPACLEGEAVVSGYHADNVGPSLLGGITLITGSKASEIRRLPVPHNLHMALVTPDVEVPTSEARAVLPQSISLKTLIQQTSGVARMIDALYRQDIEIIAEAMESDLIAEPARAHLMPMLAEMRVTAKQNGALALVISGAGPTLCAVCDQPEIAHKVASAMQNAYENAGIQAISRATQVDENGARVLSLEEA